MEIIKHTCDKVASGLKDADACCDCVATNSSSANCSYQRRSLIDELTEKGIRLTSQRRVLIEIIQSAQEHLDAATLLEQARKLDQNIDRATVYRTIELLKKLRLIDELDLMHLKGEKHYYEVKTRRDHIHLACFQCGQIAEFSGDLFEKLKQEIAARTGFEVRVTRFEVGGRCKACQSGVLSVSAN